mgnify:CR=1 FL=1
MMWLYALLPPGDEPPPALGPGAAGEPLSVIDLPTAGLRALVGRPGSRIPVAADTLRAHDEAVRRVAAAAQATLPARFGQTAPDEAALDAALAPRASAFAAALERVRDCEQMTLRLFGPPSAPEDPHPAGPGAELGPGARYLAGRRARAAATPPALTALLERLAPLVREARLERTAPGPAGPGPQLLASVYQLVPRAQLTAYRAAFDAHPAPAAPHRITLSGPWPPYAFAP